MFKMGSILKTKSTSKLEVLVSFRTIAAQKKIKNPEASSNQFFKHVVRFLVCTKSSKLGRGKYKKNSDRLRFINQFLRNMDNYFSKDTRNRTEWSTSFRFSLRPRRQKLSA